MKALFILNDGPYGSERTYNGLRLAGLFPGRKAPKNFWPGTRTKCMYS